MAAKKYIVVEGPIGVGKSSLAKLLAAEFQARTLFESVEDNPFLAKFYQDRDTYAFQNQLFFLLNRYRQQRDLVQQDLFSQATVSDYLFAKDKIFASLTLNADELALYQQIYQLLDTRLPKPDLVVFLQARPDVLYKRLKKRDKSYERSVTLEYLTEVAQAYSQFFFHYDESPLLVVNTSEIDFVASSRDLADLVREINNMGSGTQHYIPLGSRYLDRDGARRIRWLSRRRAVGLRVRDRRLNGLPPGRKAFLFLGDAMAQKVTVPEIVKMKRAGQKITALTAYDYSFARILDDAGIDILLVGDSLGSVVQGQPSTLPVTLAEMLYHTRIAARGRTRALLVGDMPFLSYQVNIEDAKRNAGRFLAEAGAEAVKLEGGVAMQATIKAIVDIGIPVMGHVGLTPQSLHRFGGYKVQGKEKKEGERIVRDALAVEEAGAFAIILEGMPADLAREITRRLTIPTIGIGAGVECDGQVLVVHDMLGLFDMYQPKFVKRYADLKGVMTDAVKRYIAEVKDKSFPDEEHSFH